MDGGIDPHEAALRRLPEAHSLALRLRSAGAANDVICDYLRIAPEGLDALMQVAAAKLAAELEPGEPAKDSARSRARRTRRREKPV